MINKRKWNLLLVSLIALSILMMVFLLGCARETPPEPQENQGEGETGKITVTDFRGEEITLDQPATKIACLLDSALTGLHMLGIKNEVVAVDKWTYDSPGYPYTAKLDPRFLNNQVPAVTGNMEQLIASQPDIVIIWSGHEDIKLIEEHGIKVYGAQINSFDEAYKMMEDLGKITGKEERAAELIDYTKNEINEIAGRVKDIEPKASAIFVWGPSVLNIAGSASTGSDILIKSGAQNAAGEISEEHVVANMEQVVKWNPDTIIMWNSTTISPETYLNDPQWKTIKAVQENRVYMLPNFFFCDLWTLKFQFAIKSTAKWLYPEEFANVDLESAKNEMIEKLYGEKISD